MHAPAFLAWTLYGNPVSSWLLAVAVAALATLVLVGIKRSIIGRLAKLAAQTETRADDLLVDLLKRTRAAFLVFVAIAAASFILTLPAHGWYVVRAIAVLALVYQAFVWGNGLIAFWIDHHEARTEPGERMGRTTLVALSYLARGALALILLLLALENLGINITALVAGLGVGGIAIALAVQNILGDLFAALSIVVDKPFVIGDSISVEQFSGTVEHVGLKTTRIRSVDGEQIIFANAELLKSRIRNFRRMSERRVTVVNIVTYDTPLPVLERLPSVIAEQANRLPDVRVDRSHLRTLGDNGYEIETVFWILSPDYGLMMERRQAFHLAVLRALKELNVELAYSTHTLLLRDDRSAKATS